MRITSYKVKRSSTDPMVLYSENLVRECAEVTEFGPMLADINQRMFAALREYQGIGLAAPQIGIPARIAVIEWRDNRATMCNPKITWHSLDKANDWEACLSLPGLVGRRKSVNHAKVERYKACTVTYLDINGKSQSLTAENFLARIVQHECDHLNGRVFTDYLKPVAKNIVMSRFRKFCARLEPDYGRTTASD